MAVACLLLTLRGPSILLVTVLHSPQETAAPALRSPERVQRAAMLNAAVDLFEGSSFSQRQLFQQRL